MSSYYCRTCEVLWPYIADFRVCPGCQRHTGWNGEEPSLSIADAHRVARQIQFDRDEDDRILNDFLASMEATLGPSVDR